MCDDGDDEDDDLWMSKRKQSHCLGNSHIRTDLPDKRLQ